MKKNHLLPLFILLFLSLSAVLPLLKNGFIPTHDGEYHLLRFWQFDKNIQAGNFLPRWAPDLDYGFGVPLFSYFYPFPNYAAELFHLLGFSFIDTFKLSSALSLILSGLFFYLWLKEIFNPWPALVGAVFYVFAPYHFIDLYVRGSIGEVWALTWLPALLFSSQKFIATGQKKYFLLTSFFFAFLVLSHNLLALLFSLFLFSWWLFFLKRKKLLFAFSFGFGLSAFFWLPAILERKLVTGIDFLNFADHFPTLFQLIFPSWGTGFSVKGIMDGLSFQIGPDHLFMVFLATIFLLRRPKLKSILIFLLAWFCLLLFFSLEISLPLWRIIPFLKYFQYPWRLNSLIIFITSFLAGYVAWRLSKKIFIFLLLGLAISLNWSYSRPVVYSARFDSFYLANPGWTQGTATFGNSFKIVGATNHEIAKPKIEIIEGQVEIKENFIKPTDLSFSSESSGDAKIKINVNYFPGWQVSLDGGVVKINKESDGSFSFSVPKGQHQVQIKFQESSICLIANLISLLSFILLLTVVKLGINEGRH